LLGAAARLIFAAVFALAVSFKFTDINGTAGPDNRPIARHGGTPRCHVKSQLKKRFCALSECPVLTRP
jgi:hypothetical protein